MPTTDDIVLLGDCSDKQALAIAALVAETWPNPDKDAAFRARQLLELGAGYDGPAEQAPRAFVVRDGERVIANAVAEPRTIGTPAGEMTILALGKVCSDPGRRGEGLGARVVRATLAMVDEGVFPFSLFQTSPQVRPFYERLGACVVDNPIINSLSEDLHASPFWDKVIMRYPAKEGWPDGEIDLRGPGY